MKAFEKYLKEFKKYQKTRMVKTIGYINNSSAYNAGEEAGWKASLMWVLKADWDTPDELTELLAQELLNNQTDNSTD